MTTLAIRVVWYTGTLMAISRQQFGLVQLFLAVTAVGFALAAVRSSGLACYALGAFSALMAGASVMEHDKHAGIVACLVMIGIYVLRMLFA